MYQILHLPDLLSKPDSLTAFCDHKSAINPETVKLYIGQKTVLCVLGINRIYDSFLTYHINYIYIYIYEGVPKVKIPMWTGLGLRLRSGPTLGRRSNIYDIQNFDGTSGVPFTGNLKIKL